MSLDRWSLVSLHNVPMHPHACSIRLASFLSSPSVGHLVSMSAIINSFDVPGLCAITRSCSLSVSAILAILSVSNSLFEMLQKWQIPHALCQEVIAKLQLREGRKVVLDLFLGGES